MADLKETNEWVHGIYQLEKTDDVIGGEDGIDNLQAKQLASRTTYLKGRVSDLELGKTAAGKASKLAAAQIISINGEVNGHASFDGSDNITINVTPQYKYQPFLGFTPVQQGGGVDQLNNLVRIGWSAATKLKVTVDTADLGNVAMETWVLAQGYTGFPTGTRLLFAQAAAPTGWTQIVDDTANNRMLRVVNGGGGNVGGTHNPILNNVVPPHTHNFTTGGHSADHTHAVQDPGHSHSVYDPGHEHTNYAGDAGSGANLGSGNANKYGPHSGGTSSRTGISLYGAGTGIWLSGATSNHTHSGSTDNGSSQVSWQPRYIDMIICSKNAGV
jgi:hypothetical protein